MSVNYKSVLGYGWWLTDFEVKEALSEEAFDQLRDENILLMVNAYSEETPYFFALDYASTDSLVDVSQFNKNDYQYKRALFETYFPNCTDAPVTLMFMQVS